MHDELECTTAAVAMYRTILDDADDKAWHRDNDNGDCGDPEAELRARLPWMLGRLSPGARAIMRDHLCHGEELVAFVHRAERIIGTRVPLVLIALSVLHLGT